MKVSSFAIASLVSLVGCDALVPSTFGRPRTATALSSLAPPPQPGNTSEDEVSNGKVLEGGKVIDFESMRGPSSAEQALYSAKIEILNSHEPYVSTDSAILGINDDVIAEVGHDLATFATPEEVQKCAAYLRSQSVESLFERKNKASDTESSSYSSADIAAMNSILRKAYVESGEVTSAFAKTFYMGTQLLPEAAREAIWAIYVWCRRTDEI
eukprot:CAMPEP_0117046528 /NCGR_PEP_ID=MMETSP0472-20121206/32169_1 /TAXON_ID=693140 ORGANISM="Tiarina fusus, Strain LIS" /NCGR_SAMPLE_ID=MMETSP0472 /ASSEMBLY_ACC=CAM_ASM_000603 /LENGTH=211 /DNA_ID=CAMNT_0004758909 /DNA_START=234 /DNA_END=866 /DNA_ORIENTATION=+